MKLVTYLPSGADAPRLGALLNDRIVDLSALARDLGVRGFPSSLKGWIAAGGSAKEATTRLLAAAQERTLFSLNNVSRLP